MPTPHQSDEDRITNLIGAWAAAVHAGELDRVLAHHSEDIVLFDVPPPHDGIRGLPAYRDAWPPFLEWQAQGGTFEIVEIDVTAGADVAFAWALLRCGTAEGHAAHPERRLRVSFGLCKIDGEWAVAHEHHSFPHESNDDTE